MTLYCEKHGITWAEHDERREIKLLPLSHAKFAPPSRCVLLLEPHPHAGEIGRCRIVERTEGATR